MSIPRTFSDIPKIPLAIGLLLLISFAIFPPRPDTPKPHLYADTIATIGSFPITNSLIMSWVTIALLIVIGILITYRIRFVPHTLQNIGETIVESGLNFMTGILGSRRKAEQAFPLIATFFLFILLSNWLGLLPGVGSIDVVNQDGEAVHLFRSTYADLNMTLALAAISVVATHFFAIRAIGKKAHLSKYITFASPILFFVGILELFGELSKIISFSFRLFGNVFAGEVLLISILGLLAYIAPLPSYGLEIFVGFIQALVFSMLTLIFIQVATTEVQH